MYCILSHDRVVFLQLNSIRSIFSVLGSDVSAGSSKTTVFVLCALKNYLDSVAFLRHFILSFPKRSANVVELVDFKNVEFSNFPKFHHLPYYSLSNSGKMKASSGLGSFISFSISSLFLGAKSDNSSFPSSVIRMQSSIRTAIPHHFSSQGAPSGM